jgi:acyl carrier protein
VLKEQDVRSILTETMRSAEPDTWDSGYVFLGDKVDSLDHATFLLLLKERHGIDVPDEDVGQLNSITGALAYASGI